MAQSSASMLDPSAVDAWRRRIREDAFSNYHLEMGLALERTGDVDAALSAYKQAVQARPDIVEAIYLEEKLTRRLGRFPEADALVRQARAIDPDFMGTAPFQLALTSMERGEAKVAYDWFLSSHEAGYEDAVAGLVATLLMMDEWEKVAELSGTPLNPKGSRARGLGRKIVRETLRWMSKTWDWPQLYRPTFNFAFKLQPDDPEVLSSYGHILMMCLETAESETVFTDLARREISPSATVDAWCFVGLTRAADQRLDEALDAFSEALRRDPENLMAHACQANLLMIQGRLAESDAPLAKALYLSPGNPSLQAYALRRRGLSDGMDTILSEHVELGRHFPTDVGVQLNLAFCASVAGHDDLAIQSVRAASTERRDQFWLSLVLLPEWRFRLLDLCRRLQIQEPLALSRLL